MRPSALTHWLVSACSILPNLELRIACRFGPRWLAAPVTTYKATSRSVYLPKLAEGQEWIYYYSMKTMGAGGSRVTMQTPIDEFPLFYIRDAWEYPDHPAGAGQ